ncbi:hypothetical protein ACHAXR_001162 [Thalassiosira sp. AJA248-18]
MLVLAPSAKDERDGESIAILISERIERLRNGDITTFFRDAMAVFNWKAHLPPDRNALATEQPRLLQIATAFVSRLPEVPTPLALQQSAPPTSPQCRNCTLPRLMTLDTLNSQPPPSSDTNCRVTSAPTSDRNAKNKGAGVNADSMDVFVDLVKLNIAEVNEDIRQVFNLVFNAMVPVSIHPYFTETYLFCLYKDPKDPTKLWPIGIPSASHATHDWHPHCPFLPAAIRHDPLAF